MYTDGTCCHVCKDCASACQCGPIATFPLSAVTGDDTHVEMPRSERHARAMIAVATAYLKDMAVAK